MKMNLDIIIPVHNEEDTITDLYNKINEEIKIEKYNIIFIDDGSNDKTLDKLTKLAENNSNIKVIEFSKQFGKENAIYAGLLHSKSELTCILDISIKNSISLVNKMLKYMEEDKNIDSVCICEKKEKETFIDKLINKTNDIELINNATYNRIITSKMRKAILDYSSKYGYNKYVYNNVGFNTFYAKCKVSTKQKDKFYILNRIIENRYLNKNKSLRKIAISSILISILSFISFIVTLILSIINKSNTLLIITIVLLLFSILMLFIFNIIEFIIANSKSTSNLFIIKNKIGIDEDYL
jgi:glucosyltransferase